MTIRSATPSDVPRIVSLLKVSLGEAFLPKSEEYWRWKHIDNPFGESPVLVAEEGETLVGVRAFMRWKWNDSHQTIQAVRAVDTATHPSFQGKGIFSKLTKSLISECERQHIDIVYNTPNEKSMPGYLKMGWVRGGQLPIEVKALRPFSMAFNVLSKRKTQPPGLKGNSLDKFTRHPGLFSLLQNHGNKSLGIFRTAYSPEYIQWRYNTIPVAQYDAAGVEDSNDLRSFFIYRLKTTRWGIEFRVTDLFYSSKEDLADLLVILGEKMMEVNADFATFTGVINRKVFSGLFSTKIKSLGPIVTVRDIKPKAIIPFLAFNKWSPSLGDMELF